MTFLVARVRVALRVPAAAIPNHDCAAAILSLRDGSLEFVVLDRMIFHVDGKALLVGNEARAAGDSPALHHAIELEPQVVVQAPRGVFLDDELISLGSVRAPPRLGGHVELALPAVYLKTHRSARTPAFRRSPLERILEFRRIEPGTGHARQFEVALPIRTWCHDATRSREGIDQNAAAARPVPPSIAEKARCVKDFAAFLVWSCRPVWLNLSQPVRLPPPSVRRWSLPRARTLQDPSP